MAQLNLPPVMPKAHQRLIRERHAEDEPRATLPSLRDCTVTRVDRHDAKMLILKYEWLGTTGRALGSYGLLSPHGELLGVALFGWPASVESRDICGREYRDVAICLERGACVHYAPKNAASFLITHAVRQSARDHGWRIFYAYADVQAGEIGTVYQACNWLYIGQGVGRTPGRARQDWTIPEEDNKVISSRTLRHRGITVNQAKDMGWIETLKHPKHKYVTFEGGHAERKKFRAALRYPPQPYPKREPVS